MHLLEFMYNGRQVTVTDKRNSHKRDIPKYDALEYIGLTKHCSPWWKLQQGNQENLVVRNKKYLDILCEKREYSENR